MGGKLVSMYSLRDDFISINIDSVMNDAALHKAQQLDSAIHSLLLLYSNYTIVMLMKL